MSNDIREQAAHVLTDRDIVFNHGTYGGLTEPEATRAVELLTQAGLLRDIPPAQAMPITTEQAGLAWHRARKSLDGTSNGVTLFAAGTLRLSWHGAGIGFVVDDHMPGRLYRGEDLAEAVDAFNAALSSTSVAPH
jgi:hypothetical protein